MIRKDSIAGSKRLVMCSTRTPKNPRSLRADLSSIALAMICCCSVALAQRSTETQQIEKIKQFSGQWATRSPGRDGITRLEIHSTATKIFIRAWGVCPQGECDWGQGEIDISTVASGVVSVTFANLDRTNTLKTSLLPNRRLRVTWRTTYSDSRLSQEHTQEFYRLAETWASVPADARSAVWSSVVEFFARQPDGKVKRVGYGFLAKYGVVATAYSVVKNTTQLRARIGADGEMSHVLEIMKSEEAKDVALVRVEGLGGWPLSIDDKSTLAINEAVYVISTGAVSSVAVSSIGVVNGISHIEIATSFSPDQSGVPVFNTRGLVVGISESNLDGATKPGLVIPAMYLTALMPDLASVPHAEPPTSVDSKPTALNSPFPRYTDEARNHGIEGQITARILVGPDGLVKQVRIVRGLPYGLNDQAIRAAYEFRFKPAMKGGQPVGYWMTITVEFSFGPHKRP
jgi:TonB family protein